MLWSRIRALVRHRFRRPHAERSLDQEIQSYLEMDIDARVRSGLTPEAARRAALSEYGGLDYVKEGIREARTGAWIDGFIHDTAAALRTLRRSPAFSSAIVVSLSLGLSAMLAATGFLNGLLFRTPSGVSAPENLFRFDVNLRCGAYLCGGLTEEEARLLVEGIEGIAGIAAEQAADVAASLPDPHSIRASLVSDNFFDVLGTRPAPGRSFRAQDTPTTGVISHQLWVRAFAEDPAIVGRTVRVADVPVEIVGVAPDDFNGLWGGLSGGRGARTEIWLPLRLASRVSNAGRESLTYVARLSSGVEVPAAQARLTTRARQIVAGRIESTTTQVEVRLIQIDPMRATAIILLVLAIPVAVLAIASMNAASLLLARASLRSHEIAVRLALGAPQRRLVRQLLIESLTLSLAATALAVPVSHWALIQASSFFESSFPFDLRLLGAALFIAVLTAGGFGLAPALTVSSWRPVRTLASRPRDLTPRQVRIRKNLVVAQVALSISVLAIGTQLVTAFAAVNATESVDSNQVLLASLDLRQVNIPDSEARQFYEQLVDRVSKMPEVDAAGAGGLTAFWWFNGRGADPSTTVWDPNDPPSEGESFPGGAVFGNPFQVAGARVSQGRTFTADDRLGVRPRVAVVNRSFADARLGGAPLGRILRIAPSKQAYAAATDVTIVGVIEPTWRNHDGDRPIRPAIFFPVPLTPDPSLTLYVRTRQPASVAGRLRDVVRQIDARVPILDVATLSERSLRAYPESWLSQAAGVLGAIALALAGFGLAALISYLVTLRAREIAVRMALGAHRSDVLRLVVVQALRLSLAGGAIGIPVAWAVGQFVRAEFHQAYGVDAVSTAVSLALLVAAALAASAFPALRASRVSPLALLKEQ